MLALLLAACSAAPEAPAPAPAPPPPPTAIGALRGALVREGGALAFRPCGEEAPAAVQGAALAEIEDVLGRLGGGATVEILGALRTTEDGRRLLDAAALQVAEPTVLSRLCGPEEGYAWRAWGSGPGWTAEVIGERVVLSAMALAAPLDLPAVPVPRVGGVVGVSGERDGHRLDLSLTPGRCWDQATGAAYPYQAAALFDGQTWRGCGREGGVGAGP